MTTTATAGTSDPRPGAASPVRSRRSGEQSGALTGTRKLVRFIVRRDRVRLAVWILGIVLLVWSTAASIVDLYPTQADLDTAAGTASDNAALLALQGPDFGLDTIGGQVVFNIGAFGYAVMALMGMFLVGRHTRADEEIGRTELLRATVVGRKAPVTAVLVGATAAFALLGALIALSLMSQDLSVEGSVLYGAAMAGFGLLFAGVTAVTAQVTGHNRTALGTAGAVLGASYVVRAIGDVGDGTLSWLSPMGWAMASRPFAGERPWTLLLLVGATLVLVGVAYALLGIRDLGGGRVAPRPGPARASAALTRPLGLATRLQRGSALGWAAALGLSGVAYGSVGQDIGDLIGDNNAVEDVVAQAGGNLTDSYLATSLLVLALITSGFAISSVLRLRSEESGGRAEPLLATALSRSRWAASHLAIALAGSAVIMLLAGLGMGATHAVAVRDADELGRLVGAAAAFVPALWVVAALTFALFGLLPRAVVIAWGALALFFVVGLFGELFALPGWMVGLSPFQHVPQMPVAGFSVLPTLAMLGIAAALVAVGMAGLRHRDAGC
jgi:polyether ionophore transport system permease protein